MSLPPSLFLWTLLSSWRPALDVRTPAASGPRVGLHRSSTCFSFLLGPPLTLPGRGEYNLPCSLSWGGDPCSVGWTCYLCPCCGSFTHGWREGFSFGGSFPSLVATLSFTFESPDYPGPRVLLSCTFHPFPLSFVRCCTDFSSYGLSGFGFFIRPG